MRPSAKPWASPLGVFALLAAVIGLGARLRAYFGGRSLWYDEILLTSNILERSWLGLTQPLHSNQSAPILFLWIEHAVASLWGPNELALRALPLVCGLALPVAIWLAGPAILGSRDALFAAIFAFLSPPLIYYSDEVKQYGVDALATIGLVALTCYLIENPAAPGRWWRFGLGSVVLLGLSQPVVFTLAGVGGAQVLSPKVRSAPRGLTRAIIIGLVWCLAFAGLYFTIYRAAADNPRLLRFWSSTFVDPHAPDFGLRLYDLVRDALVSPLPLPLARVSLVLIVLAFGVGVVRAAKVRGLWVVALLVLPLIALGSASALARYPVATRFLLCTAPLVFLAFGSLFGALVDVCPPAMGRPATAALGGLVLVLGAGRAIDVLANPPPLGVWPSCPPCLEETRPLILEVERQSAGQPIYLLWRVKPAWWFYRTYGPATRGGGPPASAGSSALVLGAEPPMRWDARHGRFEHAPDSAWADGEAARMASVARPTVWLLASHSNDSLINGLVGAAREAGGRVVYAHLEPGAALFRLRFSGPSR